MDSDEKLSNEYDVTFRFIGDKVQPTIITTKLGIQPSKAHRKGDVVEKHPERSYPTGYWGLNSSISSKIHIEKHLQELLDILEPHSLKIKELKKTGILVNFYCGIFTYNTDLANDFIKLEAEILLKIANLDASLEMHIYCCSEDE